MSSVGMALVLVPAGSFTMGSPEDEPKRRANEGPRRRVTLESPFYLGAAPVTQSQFEAVMGCNPSFFQAAGTADFPVERVSWSRDWYVVEDREPREGELTDRGLALATRDRGFYLRARRIFAHWAKIGSAELLGLLAAQRFTASGSRPCRRT